MQLASLCVYARTSLLSYAFIYTSLRAYAPTSFFKCFYAMGYERFWIGTVNCLYRLGLNGIEIVYEFTSLVDCALINSRAC